MDLMQIKKTLETKKSDRDKLLGQRDMLMEKLKKMGFNTVNEASRSLAELQDGLDKIEKTFEEQTTSFKEKYKDLL